MLLPSQWNKNPVRGITFNEKGLKGTSDSIRCEELMPSLYIIVFTKSYMYSAGRKYPDLILN